MARIVLAFGMTWLLVWLGLTFGLASLLGWPGCWLCLAWLGDCLLARLGFCLDLVFGLVLAQLRLAFGLV